jgi:hypothetical protein
MTAVRGQVRVSKKERCHNREGREFTHVLYASSLHGLDSRFANLKQGTQAIDIFVMRSTATVLVLHELHSAVLSSAEEGIAVDECSEAASSPGSAH